MLRLRNIGKGTMQSGSKKSSVVSVQFNIELRIGTKGPFLVISQLPRSHTLRDW